jgi:hypothetical protein
VNGYLTLTRIDGDPGALLDGYRRSAPTMDEVGRDHGLVAHGVARTDDGLLVVNLWPSRDGSESAARDPRRLDRIAAVGIEPGQIRPEHHELERYVLFAR